MPIVLIRRFVLAVATAIICVLLQKLEGHFEGGPPVGVPSDAVPVWRNPDLRFINKFLEYVFPLMDPLGSMTRCYIEVPDHDCMRKVRETPSRGVDMMWGLAFDKTHGEIIEKIPRENWDVIDRPSYGSVVVFRNRDGKGGYHDFSCTARVLFSRRRFRLGRIKGLNACHILPRDLEARYRLRLHRNVGLCRVQTGT